MPLGSLLGGLLARVDLTTPLLVGGVLSTAAALIWFPFVSRLPDPEDLPDQPAPQPEAGARGTVTP
jgi:hypothetical protein